MPTDSSPARFASGTRIVAARAQLGKLILLVSDDERRSTVVADYLRARGYRACIARTASLAFARVVEGESGEGARVDLVLTGVLGDGTSGLDLVAALRGIDTHAKVMLSGRRLTGDQRELSAIYGVDVLDGPLTPESICEAIEQVLATAA
jgi:DNA-binding response OmpR family regulator